MSDWAIECEGLTRDFGRKRAVWDLNLRVPRGSVVGFLGRNGCGKTTTIRLLMGLLRPTAGVCRVLGHESFSMPDDVRARVGYLIEGHPLYRTWKIRQLEAFVRPCSPRWDAAYFKDILGRFDIDPASRVWSLSRGQRGMVALALVLASGPELLILDDPAMGLDAIARRTFLESVLKVIQKEGRTILFASHHLGDVERIADRVVVMEKGVLRVDCPTDEFLQRVRRVEFESPTIPSGADAFPGLLDLESKGGRVRLTVVNLDDERRDQLRKLAPGGFDEVPLNLEDAFIAYTGSRPLREAASTKGD